MQTIARANRVWRDQQAGTIVDHVDIFRNLQQALALYAGGTAGDDGDDGDDGGLPIGAKDELRDALAAAITETAGFLAGLDVDLATVEAAQAEGTLGFIAARDDTVNQIRVNDDTQREFLSRANRVDQLLRALLPDPSASESIRTALVIRNLAETVRGLKPKADLSALSGRLKQLLDGAVTALDYDTDPAEQPAIDLSFINFDELADKFSQPSTRTLRLTGCAN